LSGRSDNSQWQVAKKQYVHCHWQPGPTQDPCFYEHVRGKKLASPTTFPIAAMHAACCLTPTFRRQFGPLNSRDEVTDTRSPPSTGAEVDPTCQFETRWGTDQSPPPASAGAVPVPAAWGWLRTHFTRRPFAFAGIHAIMLEVLARAKSDCEACC
jgi:hypothetical protein